MRREKYRMSLEVAWQKYKNQLFVVNLKNKDFYLFTDTAYDYLLCLLLKNMSFGQTVSYMTDRYKINSDVIGEDLKELIESLEEIKIIEKII